MKLQTLSALLLLALASNASAAAPKAAAPAAAATPAAAAAAAPAPAAAAAAAGNSTSSSTPPATPGGVPGYPTMDVPPPTNQPWFRKIDLSKIPNIPPRKTVDDCPKGAPDPNCAWSCTGCTRSTDFTFCPNKGDWGLSFDDGPSHSSTNKLMDYLDTVPTAKASFFIVGSRVVEFPETLLRTYKAGHHIGVHTWSHTPLTTQTTDQIIAELLWTEKIIKQTIGVTPKWMRPPYGDIDDRVRAIITALGYRPAIWNRDTDDFTVGSNPNFNMAWVPANFTQWTTVDAKTATTGFCSLEHDIYMKTVAVVPQNVPILQKANFNIKSVADCVGDNNPYQDVSGSPVAGAANGTTSSSSGTSSGSSGSSGASSSSSNSASGSNTTTAAAKSGSPAQLAGSAVGALAGVAIAALTFL